MDASIVGRAKEKGLLSWGCVNPRDFSEDKHRKVDDRPFGGGPGMLMMPEPLAQAIKSVKKKGSKVIFQNKDDLELFYELTKLDETTSTLDALTGGMFGKRAWKWNEQNEAAPK